MRASGGDFDHGAKQDKIAQLEVRLADPALWSDPQEARQVMRRLMQLQGETERWARVEQQLSFLSECLDLPETEHDAALLSQIESTLADTHSAVDTIELDLLLNGPDDDRDAFLVITAEMGDCDAQGWAAQLLHMYLRWAERNGLAASLIDQSPGEEAGLKSATIELQGPHAYGRAKAEAGQHQLIRHFSTLGSALQRCVALVEVLPQPSDASEVVIVPDDIRIHTLQVARNSGRTTTSPVQLIFKGGQPEQLVLLRQRREVATRVLRGYLLKRTLMHDKRQRATASGPARTYRFDPTPQVKDCRSGYETSNVAGVLEGDLNGLIEAYLRWEDGGED